MSLRSERGHAQNLLEQTLNILRVVVHRSHTKWLKAKE